MEKLRSSLDIEVYNEKHFQALQRNLVNVPVSEPKENETSIYRSGLSPGELAADFKRLKTVEDLFENTVSLFPNRPFLGTRYPEKGGWSDFKWKTYKQVQQEQIAFGSGLVQLYETLPPQEVKFMGIFAPNRQEWIISDLGSMLHKIPSVSLYSTLGAESSKFIINHAKVAICVATADRAAVLLEIAKDCPTLKTIILLPTLLPENPDAFSVLSAWGSQLGIKIVKYSTVIEMGTKRVIPPAKLAPTDICALQYTSGTTGNPKGVMITHSNFVSAARAGISIGLFDEADKGEFYLSYLPLAHIMERSSIVQLLTSGASIGFFRGDISLLLEDIAALKPTFFVTVPRLLVRIYDKVMQATVGAGGIKSVLFQKALADKLANLKATGQKTHPLWDPILFSKVKAILGGRVKFIGTGSAPISPEILAFLRTAFCCTVYEGYGLTESTSGMCGTVPFDITSGNVGMVALNAEVKLVSVPEMNYFAKDKKGEIWIRGPCIFKGYYLDKAKTDEALTADGWFQTGDIGRLDDKNRVYIVDRKKNIFKLAQGEYVAPEKLENIYIKCPTIAQAFIHGDSLQSELVGVIVPDQDVCIPMAISKGWLPKNTIVPPPLAVGQALDPMMATLAKNEQFKKAILDDIAAIGKKYKLAGYEVTKAIYVESELFTAENGILTPTLKLKRQQAVTKYRPIIDQLYQELNSKQTKAKF